MTLGEVLNDLHNGGDPLALLAEDIEVVTLARASAAAETCGLSLSDYVRAAVASFVNGASEEEWMQLVGRLQNGDCSAGVCLYLMLARHLDQPEAENPLQSRGRP